MKRKIRMYAWCVPGRTNLKALRGETLLLLFELTIASPACPEQQRDLRLLREELSRRLNVDDRQHAEARIKLRQALDVALQNWRGRRPHRRHKLHT